jgi:hypothetical protein
MSLSLFVVSLLAFLQIRNKSLHPKALLSLFIFGIILSIPFVLVEHLAFHLKFYFVILAFIGIELIVVLLEHKWKFLHDLIHHNVKTLKLLSFFLVGIGFAYSELSFYILHTTESVGHILTMLPIKSVFAIFMHTVLASTATMITAAESVIEHFLLFFLYYVRLVFISISHYIYIFLTEHKIFYILIPFLLFNLFILLREKRILDKKSSTLILQ